MTSSSTRRAVAAAVTIGVGGLAVVAGAGEASSDDPTTTTSTPASSDDPTTTTEAADPAAPPAEEDRPSGEAPHGGRPGFLDDVLDGLVEDGTLSQDQADAVTDGLAEKAQEWRDGHPRPERTEGADRPERPGRGAGAGHLGLKDAFDAAAEVIGAEPDALRDGLRDGRSIADIAEEAGVSRQDVIDAIVAKASAALDEAVAAGHLDEAKAADLRDDLPGWTERIVDLSRPR